MNLTIFRRVAGLAALLVWALHAPVALAADPLPDMSGETVLTVSGDIAVRNAGETAVMTLEFLRSLPATSVATETPWTTGSNTFRGVLLRDLLARIGAGGTRVVAAALNDYTVEIPLEDAAGFDVIIAYEMDGMPLDPAERGPLWVMYPYTSHPEIADDTHYGRAIWQLDRLAVK